MSLLMERWAMMGKHTRAPEYQEVAWVQPSSSTSYVEIPYTPNLADTIRFSVYYDGLPSGDSNPISCGAGTYQLVLAVRKTFSDDGTLTFYIRNMSTTGLDPNYHPLPNAWIDVFIPPDGNCTVDGRPVTNTRIAAPDDTVMWIFKRRNGAATMTQTRMSGVTITRNGADLIDLIPCYRKSDNKIGYYDTVGQVFYPGTGSFTKGADVN